MQIDKIFSTQFVDGTAGTPITDLTGVTISILELNTDGTTASIPVDTQPCFNGTNGFYRYYFSGMENKVYEYYFNPNDSRAFISSGFVDKRLNNLDSNISDIMGGRGGDYSNAIQTVKTAITKNHKEVLRKIEELPKTDLAGIESKLSEIDSHNNLAKDNIINTIKETENYICKDIKKTNTELTKDNVATRQLIRQKSDKIDKNISKLNDKQELTDKMIEDEADELEEEIDKLYEKEADEFEKELDNQLNAEFDQIESETNQLTNGNN